MQTYVTSNKFIKLICCVFIANKNQKHQFLNADVEIINKNIQKNEKRLRVKQAYIKVLEDEAIRIERLNERLRIRLEGIN